MQYATKDSHQSEHHPLALHAHDCLDHHEVYTFHSDCKGNLLEEILRLRCEIYCRECGFERVDPFFEDMESDPFDVVAAHFSAMTKDKEVVGTVRLVQPISPAPFPFEFHCDTFQHYQMPRRGLCAEVSRLAVKKDHRRHPVDAIVPRLDQTEHFLPQGKHGIDGAQLLMGMFREIYRYSVANDIRYWFAAMERSLVRSLKAMGFDFTLIGPAASYNGTVRRPYVLDLQRVAAELANKDPALVSWFGAPPS